MRGRRQMKVVKNSKLASAIAGVLALCSANVQAQSSSHVTMYGVFDVGLGTFSRSNTVDKRLTKINIDTNSSSIWGLRGSEDLGGGLAAEFGLEAALDPKSGNATGTATSGANTNATMTGVLWRRSSWVGLKGNFGSLHFGRDYTATILAQLVNGSGMPNFAINSSTANIAFAQGIGNDFWNSNMIRYDSPVFGGFSVGLQYALGEVASDSSAGNGFGGVVNYANGPFRVGVSYQKNNGVGVNADDNVHYWMLTGSYDVGNFRISALYDEVKNKGNVIPLGWIDSKAWLIGGNYAISPLVRVGLQYGEVKDTIGDTKSKHALVTAQYSLSKRTYLFANFANAKNGNVAIQPLWGAAPGITQQTVKNDTINGFAMGVVHRF